MIRILTVILIVVALGSAIVIASLPLPCEQPIIQSGKTAKADQSPKENCPSAVGLIGAGVHTYRDEITALSTLVIAVFTTILGLFTISLAKSTRKAAEAADLSAKAAIGVELPIITLLRMDLMHGPGIMGFVTGIPPDTIRPMITLKNIGRTAAELIAGGITTQTHDVLPEKPIYTPFPFAAGRLLIEDGTVSIPPHRICCSFGR